MSLDDEQDLRRDAIVVDMSLVPSKSQGEKLFTFPASVLGDYSPHPPRRVIIHRSQKSVMNQAFLTQLAKSQSAATHSAHSSYHSELLVQSPTFPVMSFPSGLRDSGQSLAPPQCETATGMSRWSDSTRSGLGWALRWSGSSRASSRTGRDVAAATVLAARTVQV